MTGDWARIEGWMRRHAPASLAALAGPAGPDVIAAAEARIGLRFPAELVESLRRHDGLVAWANVMPEAPPLGTGGIAEAYLMRNEIAPEVGGFTSAGPGFEAWWNELWLPFGDSDGDLQVIDLRPGPGQGRLGIAPHDNPADFTEGWPSLGAYLTAVADGLEHRGSVGPWHPYLTVEDELWWSLAGETELNGEPLRPAP